MSATLLIAACGGNAEAERNTAGAADTSEASTVTREPRPERRESNVEMRRLVPGEKPPQFLLFSFDGVGVSPNWDLFLDAAGGSDARFTALMTGLYFLTDDKRRKYRGPGHRPGESSLAFGGTKDEVVEQIEYLNRTWYAGHEMGTHYVGHFCNGTKYPGKSWTAADWEHELDQFFALMQNWRTNNNIRTGPDLAFDATAVKGGRTQCLEGSMRTIFPALRAHEMTWDSSMPAHRTGVYWPTKINGIWEFPIPYVWSPALNHRQTALDYNFWFSVNGATDRKSDKKKIGEVVLSTYRYMFNRAYHGNRAPIVIANHLNDWNSNAFNPPTAKFMRETCGKAEVVCATYQDVIAWMEYQDPAVLRKWTAMPAVAVSADR